MIAGQERFVGSRHATAFDRDVGKDNSLDLAPRRPTVRPLGNIKALRTPHDSTGSAHSRLLTDQELAVDYSQMACLLNTRTYGVNSYGIEIAWF
jgi:hypothetical protein